MVTPKLDLLHSQPPADLAELKAWLVASLALPSSEAAFFAPPHPLELELTELALEPSQLEHAVKRLLQARERGERVVIAGDYDADGLSATALLWQALAALGLQALPFIPDRSAHGYGLNAKSVAAILASQPQLVVTVDNGIVAAEAVKSLVAQGVEVIVTDHHESEAHQRQLLAQQAVAIVHTTQLSGTTVAWVLARELLRAGAVTAWQETLTSWLDLATIATIADQVPLLGANRSFAWHGLSVLLATKRPGLLALFAQIGLEPTRLDERTVGYQLAPRLNALGRLSHGLEALRLLVGERADRARERAALLDSVNQERQELTETMMSKALTQVEAQAKEHLLIVSDASFHEGIIGLIAGRCLEATGKPCLALAPSNGFLKGSARSVPEVNMTDFLRASRALFLDLGGHAMAAGFSLDKTREAEFTETLWRRARHEIKPAWLKPRLPVLAPLSVALLNLETVALLSQFRPFGSGNPEPNFLLEHCQLLAVRKLGNQGQHRKYLVRLAESTAPVEVLWWSRGQEPPDLAVGETVSLVVRLASSNFRGQARLDLILIQMLS